MKKIEPTARTIPNLKDKMFETDIATDIAKRISNISVKSRANYGIRPESKLPDVLNDSGRRFSEKLSPADRYKITTAQRAYVLPK